jgi:formate hydrogenlyase subunit 4
LICSLKVDFTSKYKYDIAINTKNKVPTIGFLEKDLKSIIDVTGFKFLVAIFFLFINYFNFSFHFAHLSITRSMNLIIAVKQNIIAEIALMPANTVSLEVATIENI